MKPNFTDILQWYREAYNRYLWRGDSDRQYLAEAFDAARESLMDNRDHARAVMQQALIRARELNEPFWELLYEYWLYESAPVREHSIQGIVALTVKANQPRYRECPVNAQIYAALMRAYVWHDPIGQADAILDGIRYVFENLPYSRRTYCALLWTKMQLFLELGEYEAVAHTATDYLIYSEGDYDNLGWGYILLTQAYFHLDEWRLALEYAQDAREAAAHDANLGLEYTALRWQHTIYAVLDDFRGMNEASAAYRRVPQDAIYAYDALYEAQYIYHRRVLGWFGRLTLVFELGYRIQQGESWKRPHLEAKSRLRRIEALVSLPWLLRELLVLVRMVPSLPAQVAAAEAVAHEKLADPAPYLAELDVIVRTRE